MRPRDRSGEAGGASPSATGPGRRDASADPALVLDPIACVGHGLCAELFPEGVVLDDWGFPIVLAEASDPALRAHAKRAAKACPALALKLRATRR
ncbi:ferredoxin [Patulibacter sp.]|uniref:ferredoxin n=1 Tax=Patulibacter sp. TaxID=1912859 RepID=UPI0027199AEC|nr:ferredoxin [Patulibacter sp.]MDO9408969.1 ferredoxin [Patulibacter sp.]